MKILIIGFQRSGTTLLRRLFAMHPEIKLLAHENFFLSKYGNNKQRIADHIYKWKQVDIDRDNWGDKTPYYPNIRRIPVKKYCDQWLEMFGKQGRIVHIYRHPYDTAFSIVSKYKGQNFEKAISIYRKAVPRALNETLDMKQMLSFKYEEMILNPDKIVPDIYKFCGLKEINFREKMKDWENPKYQTFDETRVFAYKGKKIPKINKPLDDVVIDLNEKLGGPRYEI
jgi:hypothetical protein